MALIRGFLQNGFAPNVIQNGRSILFMELKSLNLRFLRSNSFFTGTEIQLSKTFSLNIEPFYFPESFNVPTNFNYCGNIPDVSYFYSILDDESTKTQKELFVFNLKNLKYKWNLQRELLRYCDEKTLILLQVCTQFVIDCFEFEILLKKDRHQNSNDLLFPFGHQICSLSGYTYKLFKILYLNDEEIFCVKNEYGLNPKKVSKVEYEWSCFQIFEHPEQQYMSAFNSFRGQKTFKECIPDLYSFVSKEAVFFNECKIHGHINCLMNPNATERDLNPFGISYLELNKEFEQKCYKLIENNADVNKVTIHWECQYRNFIKTSSMFDRFKAFIFQPHPLIRLRARTCCRGSYSDVYRLKWLKNERTNEKLYFLDVNGLYSYACFKFPLMIGRYDILMGEQLSKIKFVNGKFFFNNIEMYGTMLVTILPPKKCFRPFLLYRTKSGKVVNTLCSKCCEFKRKVVNCRHSDSERAITSSYFISELNASVKYNYKILYIHECHFYKEANFFMKSFVQKLNALKVKHTNILKDCVSSEEKLNYCEFLNEEMELRDSFRILPSSVNENKSKRFLYKQMANGFFGKFQQLQNKSKTIFVRSQNNLENLYFSNNVITDLFCINEDFCKVQLMPKDEKKLPPNLKNNCYIGGQIVAYSREIIYEHLNTIEKYGGTLYQVECDSIIFSLPLNVQIPINISDALGHFKHVLDGEILSFYSFGPKNYSITYQKPFANPESYTRISGISLNNVMFNNELNDKLFNEYLTNLSFLQKTSIAQVRTKLKKKTNEIVTLLEKTTYSNQLTNRRILKRKKLNPELIMYPYGF
jgi:hypothetical protein